MPSSRDIKNKVLKTAKQTAETAKSGLDQALLTLEHSSVKKMADKMTSPEAKDLIARLSQKVLDQSKVIRANLDPSVLKPMADIVSEEVKTQIEAVKKDPKGSATKAKHAATAVATKAAKGARQFVKKTLAKKR